MRKIQLTLLLMCIMFASQAQMKELKIISYNIYVGMKTDTTANKHVFSEWFRKQDADVVGLQEVTGFTQSSLEEWARSYGHRYAVLLIEGEKYPVAFTSKYPITGVQKVTDNMDRGFIQATIGGQTFIVLHLSPFDYRTRRTEVDLLLAHVKNQPQITDWVLMGDFNSFSSVDSLAYRDGRLKENLRKYEAKYPPYKKLIENKIDYQIIDEVLAAGFSDALKIHHPEFVKTVHPKRFEPKQGRDVPTRIDYIFVSKKLFSRVTKAEVIVDHFTDNHSDHYPMMMKLKLKR